MFDFLCEQKYNGFKLKYYMEIRPIKFRAWDKEEGRMWFNIQEAYDTLGYHCHEKEPDNFYGNHEDFSPRSFGDVLDNDLYIPMQSTGLKDKNGKEIYEGDIVEYTFQQNIPENFKVNLPVIFHQGTFAIAVMNDEPLSLRDAIKNSNKADGLTVIGNIYENPELLK